MGNVERLMVKSYVFNTTPGTNYIYDAELAYTQLLFCSREGLEYDILVFDRPDYNMLTRQVQHSQTWGFIRFAVPFNPGETVQIIIGEI